MRSVSKTMYTIGKIINIIEIVFAILFIVLGVFMIASPNVFAEEAAKQGITALDTPKEARVCGVTLVVWSTVAFVVSLIIFLFAKKATRSLQEEPKKTTGHTIMLVIGVFGDIFYFLGGLFGVLGANEAIEADIK